MSFVYILACLKRTTPDTCNCLSIANVVLVQVYLSHQKYSPSFVIVQAYVLKTINHICTTFFLYTCSNTPLYTPSYAFFELIKITSENSFNFLEIFLSIA